jgi:hypothetical protein
MHHPPVRVSLGATHVLVNRFFVLAWNVKEWSARTEYPSPTRFCSLGWSYWARRVFRGLTGAYANALLVAKEGLRKHSAAIPEDVAWHCSRLSKPQTSI